MKRSRERESGLESESDDEGSKPPVARQGEEGQTGPAHPDGPPPKITELDDSAADTRGSVAVTCVLPPHNKEPLVFNSYAAHEAHYLKAHLNRCVDCGKNFPSDHLLNVHIEDFHDALVAVSREKGKHTYSCFVEGCPRKCATHEKRRRHLIDKHMYPKNFFFGIAKDGIDGRNSLLLDADHHRRPRHLADRNLTRGANPPEGLSDGQATQNSLHSLSSIAAAPASAPAASTTLASEIGPLPPGPVDSEMEDLASALTSSLTFVPMSVQFGRGKGKGGFARR